MFTRRSDRQGKGQTVSSGNERACAVTSPVEAASNPSETHFAQLAAMGLRRAKVVCQSGEYLCLIRDVSEIGIGLGFCHTVPPEPRILLQLANTLTFPIERVWTGQRQAGYRFARQIALNELICEQSPFPGRALRLQFSAPVRIQDRQRIHDARLLDLSCEGAKLASAVMHETGRLISFELAGMEPQLAQTRWSDDGTFGVRFHHPLTTEELALAALRHQPFGETRPSGFSRLLAKARAA